MPCPKCGSNAAPVLVHGHQVCPAEDYVYHCPVANGAVTPVETETDGVICPGNANNCGLVISGAPLVHEPLNVKGVGAAGNYGERHSSDDEGDYSQ
jgi:hypothetical protein